MKDSTESNTQSLIPMDALTTVTPMLRAVAHPIRLRILDYLRNEGEARTVSQIEEACGAQQAVVSQQLRILKDQGVLGSQRQGNFVFYSIATPSVLLILDCIRQHNAGASC
ncbi:MAG TPA: metalloregulator ArsR/SmtB family transcription factor [Armatimonadota bacterium]